ncbi:MAG TPA: aldo/keto reductase [Allosphingosinicella sp.]|jgi:aryl-alcohol dehydrogenase-like predicted oxidoreductase
MSGAAAARLGLGTVQFGLAYGITNSDGRISDSEAAAILARCAEAGIDLLDTANLYGESESAIGRAAPSDAAFRIVTKTPKAAGARSADEAVAALQSAFAESLEKLRQPRVDALLLHDPADLLGPMGPALWSAMEALKRDGLVRAIGVSIYEGAEIDAALAAFPIDIVQLPWNPLDQRLERGGQLAALANAGVEVHARSLFLQGLLLQDAANISARFGPLRDAIAALHADFREVGLSPLEGILAHAFARPKISRFVVGVTSAAELDAILLAGEKAAGVKAPLNPSTSSGALDARYLNPARWSELG